MTRFGKKMDRLSSARISTSALDFFDAGVILARAQKDHFPPTYFAFGQSIELTLKAYLRAKGYSKKQLRAISHDLTRCLTTARSEGIDALVRIRKTEVKLVDDLNVHYLSKDLQYTEVGLKKRYPHIDRLQAFAARIGKAVRPFAVANLNAHDGKSTAVL